MPRRHEYVFNGPVDLSALRGLNLRNCNLHFNGPFQLQDLAGVRLTDATVIINPQGRAPNSFLGYPSDNDQPTFVRGVSYESAQQGETSALNKANPSKKNTRKRPRTNDVGSDRQSATGGRAYDDVAEGRLRYDDYEEGEVELSCPRKRLADSPADAIHPARVQMLQSLAHEDCPDHGDEALVDRRTKANTASMPFNRLDIQNRSAPGAAVKFGQPSFHQHTGESTMANGSSMNGGENMTRAQFDEVDEFLQETENALMQDHVQYNPGRSCSMTRADAAVWTTIREAGSRSLTTPMPDVPSEKRNVLGDVHDEYPAGDNAMKGKQSNRKEIIEHTVSIKQEVIEPIESPQPGGIGFVPPHQNPSHDGQGSRVENDLQK